MYMYMYLKHTLCIDKLFIPSIVVAMSGKHYIKKSSKYTHIMTLYMIIYMIL